MSGHNSFSLISSGPNQPTHLPAWVRSFAQEVETLFPQSVGTATWAENGHVCTGTWLVLDVPATTIGITINRDAAVLVLSAKSPLPASEGKSLMRDAYRTPAGSLPGDLVYFNSWLMEARTYIRQNLNPRTVPTYGKDALWVRLPDFNAWGHLDEVHGTIQEWVKGPPSSVSSIGPHTNPWSNMVAGSHIEVLPLETVMSPIEQATNLAMQIFSKYKPTKKYWDISESGYNVDIEILHSPEVCISMMRNHNIVEISLVLHYPPELRLNTVLLGYDELPLPAPEASDLTDYAAWFSLAKQTLESRIDPETVPVEIRKNNTQWRWLPDMKVWACRHNAGHWRFYDPQTVDLETPPPSLSPFGDMAS